MINEYSGRYHLFHVDLYRIENYADFDDIGLYEILRSDGIVAIEWADKLPKNLLPEYLAIHIGRSRKKSKFGITTTTCWYSKSSKCTIYCGH